MGELLRKTIGRITEAEAKKEDSELQMYSQEPSGAMGEQDPEPAEEPTGDAERVAQEFHETYERLAPEHGYDTRDASKGTWDEVPEENRNLMTAVVNDLLERGVIAPGEGRDEVDTETPPEEAPLPETGDGDPWVPLEAVEGFCGECAREMMSRNIKAARLSVLTEAGLVEVSGREGGRYSHTITAKSEKDANWIAHAIRDADPTRWPGVVEKIDVKVEGDRVVVSSSDMNETDLQRFTTKQIQWAGLKGSVLEQEEVSPALLGPSVSFKIQIKEPKVAHSMEGELQRIDPGVKVERFASSATYIVNLDDVDDENRPRVRSKAQNFGLLQEQVEKKATKGGWSKKLKAGRFTEWCKRNGFKGGPSIASVKKVMESGDESVRGCAKFFADIIKPEGKDFAAIMGKEKK